MSFKFLGDEFVYGGHLQSLGAAGIVFVAAVLLDLQVTFDAVIVAYLIFYPLYLYNRYKEIKKDYLTNPQRSEHIQKFFQLIPTILFLNTLLLVAVLLVFGNFKGLIFSVVLLFFGLLYTSFFKKLTKKIALFKNFYVALFFSLLIFLFLVYYSYSFSAAVFALAGFVFLKALLMQIFLDVKDLEQDKKEKLLTFPVLFGKEKTLAFLKIINIFVVIPFLLIFVFCSEIFPQTILFLLLTVPFSFYCFNFSKKQNYAGYILAGGEFLLWPVLILIGKIVL